MKFPNGVSLQKKGALFQNSYSFSPGRNGFISPWPTFLWGSPMLIFSPYGGLPPARSQRLFLLFRLSPPRGKLGLSQEVWSPLFIDFWLLPPIGWSVSFEKIWTPTNFHPFQRKNVQPSSSLRMTSSHLKYPSGWYNFFFVVFCLLPPPPFTFP